MALTEPKMAPRKEIKINKEKYPTAPVQMWGKLKELRRKHFRHVWEAHSKGALIIGGMANPYLSLPAGFGDYATSSYGPYFTGIMRDRAQAVKMSELTESHGYGHDICDAMRCHMGQFFSGMTSKSPLTGEQVVPDFIFQPDFCVNGAKCGNFFSEHQGIPLLSIDMPFKDSPSNRQYLAGQLLDAIEWIEKLTGRTYDDEKFLQAARCEWETTVLWSKICCLLKNVPAPLDARHMMSLRQPIFSVRHQTETVQVYQDLLAEVEQRVRDGLSARGFERVRLSYEPGAPFFFPNLYRYPEQYGAITLISEEYWGFGCWAEVSPEGHWNAATLPWERSNNPNLMRTREDGIQSLVDRTFVRRTGSVGQIGGRIHVPLTRALDWKLDGSVFHVIRGCRALDCYVPEAKLQYDEAGIPNTTYEGAHADPRDFDQPQVLDRLDAFMESLGLTKIEEGPIKEEKAEADDTEPQFHSDGGT